MNEQPVSVSKISWQDLCPWTNIFKTLSIAISPSVVLWALAGVLVTSLGWFVAEKLFVNEALRADPMMQWLVVANHSPYEAAFAERPVPINSISLGGIELSGPLRVFAMLVVPFSMLFELGQSSWKFLYFLCGALWSIATWSFVGCAITRICLLRLTRNEALNIEDTFDFAVRKFLDCVGAVAMPLIGVALLCIPMFLIGLLLTFDIGALLMSVLWFVVLAVALVEVVLLIGLMFGWPLIVSSVSAEGQNSFDATTRAFAYTMQRPLNYLFYAVVAVLFGGFCWLIVHKATLAVVEMGYWSTSWGANVFDGQRSNEFRNPVEPSNSLRWATNITGFWNAFAKTVATAFLYGLFWCMSSAIYLLLRKDVDETEMDEIFVADEQRTYDLPPLKSDEMGIPQVQDPEAGTQPPGNVPG